MNTAEILRAAAVRVRQGWCQGRWGDGGERVCALGAIRRVIDTADISAFLNYESPVEAALERSLGLERDTFLRPVPRWNDAPGQTAEGVAAGLELAAAAWELEQTPPVQWTHREPVMRETA